MICVSCAAGADMAAATRRQRAKYTPTEPPSRKALRNLHLSDIEVINLHGVCTNPATCPCQHRRPPTPEPGEPQP